MTAPAADLDNLGNDMPLAGHEGDAMPNPDPGSSAAGESGADPGVAMPNPDPGSSAAGESGAEPVVPNVPNVTLPMLIEWCRIGNCYRRDELVYIQLRDNDVVHGFTLNERNDLHYFWEHPNGLTTCLQLPIPIRMVIKPEIGYEYGSCKLIIGNDSTLGLDGEFIADFQRFTHLHTEVEPPLAPAAAQAAEEEEPPQEEEEDPPSDPEEEPPSDPEEEPPADPEEEEDGPESWDAVYDEYRVGNQLWLMT